MYCIPLGYVTVPAAGTPVAMASVVAAFNAAMTAAGKTVQLDPNEKVHKIEFWPLVTNTGVVYVGLDVSAPMSTGAAMNKGTGLNILKAIQVPAASGHQDFFFAEDTDGSVNTVRIADYALDVATSGQGFMIYAFKN